MRSVTSIAVAAITALALTACGSSDSREDLYLQRLSNTGIDTGDSSTLVSIGNDTCSRVADAVGDGTVDDLPYSGVDLLTDEEAPARRGGYNDLQVATISLAALMSLCPEVFDLSGDEVQKEWDGFVSDLDIN